jgi:hypothetical protein
MRLRTLQLHLVFIRLVRGGVTAWETWVRELLADLKITNDKGDQT